MKKRFTALLLCLAICVTFMPTVFFQSVQEVYAEIDFTYQSQYTVAYHAGEHGTITDIVDPQQSTIYLGVGTYPNYTAGTLAKESNKVLTCDIVNSKYWSSPNYYNTEFVLPRIAVCPKAAATLTNLQRLQVEDGWEFDGWYLADGTTAYTFPQNTSMNNLVYATGTDMHDLQLYAHYVKADTLNVVFDANEHGTFVSNGNANGFSINAKTTTASKSYDTKEEDAIDEIKEGTTPGADNIVLKVEEGYTFKGWYNAKEDGNVVHFQSGYRDKVGDMRVYAHYEETHAEHEFKEYKTRNFDGHTDFRVLSRIMSNAINAGVQEGSPSKVTFAVRPVENFKILNDINTYNTVYTKCDGCDKQYNLKLVTKNSNYDGNPVKATVVGLEDWNDAGLEEFEVKYLNYSKLETAWMDCIDYFYRKNGGEGEVEYPLDPAIQTNLQDFTDYIKDHREFKTANLLSDEAVEVGNYIAMLVPEKATDFEIEALLYSNDFFNKTFGQLSPVDDEKDIPCAMSCFTISNGDVDDENDWYYENRSKNNDINITGITGFLDWNDDGLRFPDLYDYDEYEELTKNENYDTIFAKNNKSDQKQSITIAVDSKKYDPEDPIDTENAVDKENWTAKGLQKYVVRYLDYDKFQKAYRDYIVDYIAKEANDLDIGGDDFDITDLLARDDFKIKNLLDVDSIKAAHIPTKKVPKDPGLYIAMLLPAGYTEEDVITLFYNNDYLGYEEEDVSCALSFFEITPNPEKCNHVWKYNGPSGVLGGDALLKVLKNGLDQYGLGTVSEIIIEFFNIPSRGVLFPTPDFREIMEKLMSAASYLDQHPELADSIRAAQAEITYDNYDKIAEGVNELLDTIIARCDVCDDVRTIKCEAPDSKYDGNAKAVNPNGAEELGVKTKTYYLSIDNLNYAIADMIEEIQKTINLFQAQMDYPQFAEYLENNPDVAQKLYIKVVGNLVTGLINIFDAFGPTAPKDCGEYVAFTTLVGKDGSLINLDGFIDELEGIINMTKDTEANTYIDIVNSLTDTVEDLFQFGITCFSVRGNSSYPKDNDGDNTGTGGGGGGGSAEETKPATDKTFTKDVQPALDYVAKNVPEKLTAYDGAYVVEARTKLDAAKAAAKELTLTQAQKDQLKAAEEKVATAEKKMTVLNGKVEGLKLVAGKKKVTVKWAPLQNEYLEGYKVYRSKAKNGTYKRIYTTTDKNVLSRVTKNLKSGKKYYYKVRGFAVIGGQQLHTQYSTVKSVKVK